MSTNNDAGLAIAGGCLALIGLPLLMVIGYLFHGFTLAIFWTWFITPLFGIKAPSIAACIGLGLLGKTLLGAWDIIMDKPKIKKEYLEESTNSAWVGSVITWGLIWLIAMICHLLM